MGMAVKTIFRLCIDIRCRPSEKGTNGTDIGRILDGFTATPIMGFVRPEGFSTIRTSRRKCVYPMWLLRLGERRKPTAKKWTAGRLVLGGITTVAFCF
jgi:hypothetical protein